MDADWGSESSGGSESGLEDGVSGLEGGVAALDGKTPFEPREWPVVDGRPLVLLARPEAEGFVVERVGWTRLL